jgi:hypothetical protein
MSNPNVHYSFKNLPPVRSESEQINWQSEKPDKLGEALADKHLRIIQEATQKWKPKRRGTKPTTPEPRQ